MFSAVVAHSEETDARDVAEEILDQCRARLAGAVPKAGLLYAAIDFDHQNLLDEINRAFPGLELIGCTTDGELSSELGFLEDSTTLVLFVTDTVDITAGVGRELSKDIEGACRAAVDAAAEKTDKPTRLCITTPEGLAVDGQSVTALLHQIVGTEIPIFGGLAGDQWRFQATYQFYGTEVLTDSLPVLLLSGDFTFSYGIAFGWNQLGDVGRVTSATAATVHTIDDAPAIEFYRKYFGPGARPTGQLPLAILDAHGGIEYLRSSIVPDLDPTGAITFMATLPEGARVRLAHADRDSILSGCAESLSIARSHLPEGVRPSVALIFSCAARRVMLGTRTQEEVQLIRGELGEDVPFCGFYCYGEISPRFGDSSATTYHNCSFVSLLIVG